MADTKAYRVVGAQRVADPDQGYDYLYIYLTLDDGSRDLQTIDMTTTTVDWTDPAEIATYLDAQHTGGTDDANSPTF